MKKLLSHFSIGAIIITTLLIVGCAEEESSIKDERAVMEKVFVVNIVPDSARLKEYLDYHRKVWPEVEAGFKKAGYQKITLYRYGFLLVMSIAVPEGADLAEMGRVAESHHPRCAEWNRLMSAYQKGIEGTSAGASWVEAAPFYSFKNQ